MLTWKCIVLVMLALAMPTSAGKRWGRRHDTCSADLFDGPTGVAVEIRIGSLPPSTSEQPVYLSWWAARKSVNDYNPLLDPSGAQTYASGQTAYAELGDPEFNGGKVWVSEAGEATVRVQAPATYQGGRHGYKVRQPHVHFTICGQHGRPQKIVFKASGPKIKGGCHKWRSETVSYKVISARVLDTDQDVTTLGQSQGKEEKLLANNVAAAPDQANKKEEESEGKDMDALEFSPVYNCLEDTKLFDQFSSTCSVQCPPEADMAHGQCVRKQVTSGEKTVLKASWRLHLDCNEKCWSDLVPVSLHMVRLTLADHLDVTFQEVGTVQIRKDAISPTTHAYLKVMIRTNRLESYLGSSLLQSFLTNASMASDLLGLTTHDVAQADYSDVQDGSEQGADIKKIGSVVTDSSLPGEISDEYAEYYAPLETKAEQQAKADGKRASIAGVDVPESVPMPAIVAAAAGLVLLLSAVAIWLHCRRQQQILNPSSGKTMNIDTKVDIDVKVEKVEVEKAEA